MGQAKRRGTFEQRFEHAVKRELRRFNIPIDSVPISTFAPRGSAIASRVLAALRAMPVIARK